LKLYEGGFYERQPENLEVDLQRLLITINARIEKLLDKGHCIGHSYFMGIVESSNPLAELRNVFATKIRSAMAKAAGPLTIYALAKHLGRHYRNVHKDVTALMEWTVIDKDEDGRVFVPWDEIDVCRSGE
jgi:hypothetical protein